jgi:hypothetical protein
MMDDLVKHVAQRTGLSEQQAQQAMHAALEFADQRLPGPVAAQVRSVLGGAGGAGGGGLPNLSGLSGGLDRFGSGGELAVNNSHGIAK